MPATRIDQSFERDLQRAARVVQPDLVAIGQPRALKLAQDARHVQHVGRQCVQPRGRQQVARGGVDAGDGSITRQYDAAIAHGFDDLAARVGGGIAQARAQDDPAEQRGADGESGGCEVTTQGRGPALQIGQMCHQRQQLPAHKCQPHLRTRGGVGIQHVDGFAGGQRQQHQAHRQQHVVVSGANPEYWPMLKDRPLHAVNGDKARVEPDQVMQFIGGNQPQEGRGHEQRGHPARAHHRQRIQLGPREAKHQAQPGGRHHHDPEVGHLGPAHAHGHVEGDHLHEPRTAPQGGAQRQQHEGGDFCVVAARP